MSEMGGVLNFFFRYKDTERGNLVSLKSVVFASPPPPIDHFTTIALVKDKFVSDGEFPFGHGEFGGECKRPLKT